MDKTKQLFVLVFLGLLISGCAKQRSFPYGTDVSDTLSDEELYRSIKESSYKKTKKLSLKITVVEIHHVEESPYLGMADNNKRVIFAIPSRSDSIVKQTLVFKGKTIYKTEREKTFYPSPDERYVLITDFVSEEPFIILRTDAGTQLVIQSPYNIEESHDYSYPFQFVSWSKDSTSITAYVTGTFVQMPEREFMAYRDIWKIDARTGIPHKESRNTQKWHSDLKWDEEQ